MCGEDLRRSSAGLLACPSTLCFNSSLVFFKRMKRKETHIQNPFFSQCRIRALQTLQSQKPRIALERELEGIDFGTYSRTTTPHPNSSPIHACCVARWGFFFRGASKFLFFVLSYFIYVFYIRWLGICIDREYHSVKTLYDTQDDLFNTIY